MTPVRMEMTGLVMTGLVDVAGCLGGGAGSAPNAGGRFVLMEMEGPDQKEHGQQAGHHPVNRVVAKPRAATE